LPQEETMSGGVYTIRIQGTEKFYIGRAVNFKARKTQHFWLLKNKNHHCKYLQNAFNKYGSLLFVEEQIENDKRKRISLEQEWLDKFKRTGLLVNHHMKASFDDLSDVPWKKERIKIPHNKGKESPFKGIKRNPEIGRKISESKKGKKLTEKQKASLFENRKKIDRSKPRKKMSEEATKKSCEKERSTTTGQPMKHLTFNHLSQICFVSPSF
jgi:group I intron endonuclease